MMPYNLLLLPVIIGYFILTFSHYFKYHTQRLTQNRILFESVAVALLIISSGIIVRTIVKLIFPQLEISIINFLQIVPIQKTDYLWTVVFSCLLSVVLLLLSNAFLLWKYKKSKLIGWAVDKHGNEIEKLFKKSVNDASLIQITLKNDKVYIGYCEIMPIPQKTNYLTLTPLLSGYRDEKKKLNITTDYFAVVDEFLMSINSEEAISLNTDIIIKQDEIVTAGMYEQEIFDKFNKVN